MLRFRRNRLDQCQQMLARLLADDRTLVEQRRQLQSQRLEQLDELRRLGEAGGVDVDGSASRRYYSGQLLGQTAVVDHNRELLQQQLQLCRQALMKANQEVKALEKLAERRRAEFVYEDERRTARVLEDTWAAVHVRKVE